jgi:hypothetical protein
VRGSPVSSRGAVKTVAGLGAEALLPSPALHGEARRWDPVLLEVEAGRAQARPGQNEIGVEVGSLLSNSGLAQPILKFVIFTNEALSLPPNLSSEPSCQAPTEEPSLVVMEEPSQC